MATLLRELERFDANIDGRINNLIVARTPATDLHVDLTVLNGELEIKQAEIGDLAGLKAAFKGKLDRSKLQKPSEAVEEAKSAVHGSFETDLERGIAEIWQRLLNIDVVGRADNFFDLGGHSLLAMRAVSDIESTLGVNISPRRLIFESLAQLAAAPGQSTTAQATKAAPAAKGWLGGLKRLFGAKAP